MILNNLIFVKDTSTLSDIITDYNSDNYNKTKKIINRFSLLLSVRAQIAFSVFPFGFILSMARNKRLL